MQPLLSQMNLQHRLSRSWRLQLRMLRLCWTGTRPCEAVAFLIGPKRRLSKQHARDRISQNCVLMCSRGLTTRETDYNQQPLIIFNTNQFNQQINSSMSLINSRLSLRHIAAQGGTHHGPPWLSRLCASTPSAKMSMRFGWMKVQRDPERDPSGTKKGRFVERISNFGQMNNANV